MATNRNHPAVSDDAVLVTAAQAGDQVAFEGLLERHGGLLAAHAARFFFPGADDDDVMQEARIGFARAVRCYRGGRGSSFPTFAALCVTRQLATALTAARRGKHRPLSEGVRGEAAERAWLGLREPEGPLDRVLVEERLVEITEASATLSALERQVLAHALAGWPSGEAADRLGVARKSADNALQRARRKMGEWEERQAA